MAGTFMEFYNQLPDPKPDIMLEVKDKNLSALKCIHLTEQSKAVQLEAEWARYKYLVLSRSARAYQSIRELLKDKSAEAALEFYQIVETAMSLPQDPGAEVNAAQHVWGYISRASDKRVTGSSASGNPEKERFERLLNSFQSGGQSITPLKKFLYRCARERKLTYLLESLYFYL
jgi:UV DNA damage endonuclease